MKDVYYFIIFGIGAILFTLLAEYVTREADEEE